MATLHVLQGQRRGTVFPLVDDTTVLGRHSSQVILRDKGVSRRHAELRQVNRHWEISDLNSANGTYVNGSLIAGTVRLDHGDQIKIGSTVLAFLCEDSSIDSLSGDYANSPVLDPEADEGAVDAPILSSIASDDAGVGLASPDSADVAQAWGLISQLAEVVGSVSSTDGFLKRATSIILRHMPADHLMILMPDADSGEMVPRLVRVRNKDEHDKVSPSSTIIKHVIDTKEGVLSANAMADERFSDQPAASIQNLGLRSVICVPIVALNHVIGVIHFDCAMSRHTYSRTQLQLATAVGRICGTTIEHLRLLETRVRDARLAAVGETVAYLSHHIRNILQGMRGGADVVDMGLNKSRTDLIGTGWRVVQHNLERIFHLTTNMLTFSKDREPRIEYVQLGPMIQDVVSLARGRADDRGVVISTCLEEMPTIPMDPEGMHQAVFNIILNAIDACDEGTGRVMVRTHYDLNTGEASIAVEDNGPGIPAERMKEIFKPFSSSKGQGGTGLGLAAAKKIVDELGGRLHVESTPGKGTVFVIRLPADRTSIHDSDRTRGVNNN